MGTIRCSITHPVWVGYTLCPGFVLGCSGERIGNQNPGVLLTWCLHSGGVCYYWKDHTDRRGQTATQSSEGESWSEKTAAETRQADWWPRKPSWTKWSLLWAVTGKGDMTPIQMMTCMKVTNQEAAWHAAHLRTMGQEMEGSGETWQALQHSWSPRTLPKPWRLEIVIKKVQYVIPRFCDHQRLYD